MMKELAEISSNAKKALNREALQLSSKHSFSKCCSCFVHSLNFSDFSAPE